MCAWGLGVPGRLRLEKVGLEAVWRVPQKGEEGGAVPPATRQERMVGGRGRL